MDKKFLITAIAAVLLAGGYFLLKGNSNVPPASAPNLNPPPPSSQSPPEKENLKSDITIENFSFNPADLSVKKGTTVVWTNKDSVKHTVVSASKEMGAARAPADSDFKSEALNKGESFEFQFNKAGVYDYICGIHPYMKGRITVVEENNNSETLKNNMNIITLKTNFGEIQFQTYDADAPKTVKNFITLAEKGFYDNLTFHRVVKGFVIQGGDPNGNGKGGPGYNFEDELNPNTESYKNGYKKGVVAMANSGPNTNGSQFFIMLEDYPLPNNYTIFGKVVKGQEVVDAIGETAVGGDDKPLKPVVIEKVTVAKAQ